MQSAATSGLKIQDAGRGLACACVEGEGWLQGHMGKDERKRQ